jgi:cytochrome c-type biogenesis protein CcmH
MSIELVIALAALSSLALGMLLLPLRLRHRVEASREAHNLAVYRDQLAEVEHDLGRGLLGPEQAQMARAEIGRRILALPPAPSSPLSPEPSAVAVIAVLLLPFAAGLLYARLGSPDLLDQPFGGRSAPANAVVGGVLHRDIGEAIATIGAYLKDHPEDLTGWLLLARSELGLGQYGKAVEAYRHAVDLSGHRANIVGDWAEAQVLAANGTVTPVAREAFAAALADKKTAPRSRYYLALAQLQHGDTKAALQSWVNLAADAPTGAKWLPLVHQRIAQAAAKLKVDPATPKTSSGMPLQGEIATAAGAAVGAVQEERRAMISAVVDNLAARLEQQPNDVDGWARLGRSYMVLNEPSKGREAFAHALKLRPDDPALRQAYAEASLAAEYGNGSPRPK